MASSVSGQDESNPALWLATRADKMERSCPLGTTRRVPQEKFPQKPYNKSFIDQACSVKMAGHWPRSFLACLWTSTPSRSINTQKKNSANIQPSWPHTWSITHTYCTMSIDDEGLLTISNTSFLNQAMAPSVIVERMFLLLSRDGAVVRALAVHRWSPGSIPIRCHMWVEFVVGSRIVSSVFLRVLRFPPSRKTQNWPG